MWSSIAAVAALFFVVGIFVGGMYFHFTIL
jgi:hypothetical protein